MLFDKSDRRLITGGDDGIVKIWCARTGFLLYSLRAHSNCISDMSVEASNMFLAVGSIDGYISIWHLPSGHHLFTINAFSPVLTLEFQPVAEPAREVILMATCSDGYAKFWAVDLQARSASPTPIKFHCKSLARDEIRCASFSPAGLRFVTGATDGIVRLFTVPELVDIKAKQQSSPVMPYLYYLEDHEGYVNSVHYRSDGTRLATSSWDGCIREWQYQSSKPAWTSKAYDTATVLGASQDTLVPGRPRKVTIVTYCCGDRAIVGAVNQTFELVYFSLEHPLKKALRYHEGEVYILTANPVDDRILLSAGCDGRAALWNMETQQRIFEFNLPNTRFLDGGFSQNGQMFALVDEMGRVSLFGCGMSPDAYEAAPASQFFPTDWNELVFDAQRNVIDSVTQRPADAAPRSMIVSIERAEYGSLVSPNYANSIPIEGADESVQERARELFLRQMTMERQLYMREHTDIPPGSIPKHTRPRRRRLLYGSDVEDSGGGIIVPPSLEAPEDEIYHLTAAGGAESETEAEVSVTGPDSPQGPYNLRRREATAIANSTSPVTRRRPRLLESLFDDEDDELYRPQSVPNHGRRVRRRRPVIQEDEEGEEDDRFGGESEGEEATTTPILVASDWITGRVRRLFPFHPQLYDIIAYLPEGHRRFMEKTDEAIFKTTIDAELEDVVFGQIVRLHFYPGPPTSYCELDLMLLRDEEAIEGAPPLTALYQQQQQSQHHYHHHHHRRKIHLAFYDMEGQADFIIPICLYRWSVSPENIRRAGQHVRVVFGDDEYYEAKVRRLNVSPALVPKRPWGCYHVEWLTLNDPAENLSPWEVQTDELPYYECTEAIEEEIRQGLIHGLESIIRDSSSAAFRKPVDLALFPDYLETVAYPMDLSLLLARLRSGYYRRLEAFEWDVRLIYENAFAYNLPDSEIVQAAAELVQNILQMMKRAERASRRRRETVAAGVAAAASSSTSSLSSPRPVSRRAGLRNSPRAPPLSNNNNNNHTAFTGRGGRGEREARARRRATLDLRQSSPPDPLIAAASSSTSGLGSRRGRSMAAGLLISPVDISSNVSISSGASPVRRRTRRRVDYREDGSSDDADADADDDEDRRTHADNDTDGEEMVIESGSENVADHFMTPLMAAATDSTTARRSSGRGGGRFERLSSITRRPLHGPREGRMTSSGERGGTHRSRTSSGTPTPTRYDLRTRTS